MWWGPGARDDLSIRVCERGSRADGVVSAARAQTASMGPGCGECVGGGGLAHGPDGLVSQWTTRATCGRHRRVVGLCRGSAALHMRTFRSDPSSPSAWIPRRRISQLVMSCCLMRGGDDDGDVLAASTVTEMKEWLAYSS